MTLFAGDGSRDRRIEDPSNLYLIHPAARALLPLALRARISANMVSTAGLALGLGAALSYDRWQDPRMALLGLGFSICWLIADGLDGMVARATGTASALGRALDGLCDHGVFVLLYVALALSIGTPEGWALAIVAGVAHAVQSSLYEGERARFHRRVKGQALAAPPVSDGMILVRLYDRIATSVDRVAMRFERFLGASTDPRATGAIYAARAVPAMRLQSLLTANVRVAAIFIACLAGDPRIFWWFEIVPLTIVAILGLFLHRAVERSFLRDTARPSISSKKQGQS